MTVPTVTLTCTTSDQTGAAVPGAVFRATLDRTHLYRGLVIPRVVEATANAQGVALLVLWPNELAEAPSTYRLVGVDPVTGRKFLDTPIAIPNKNCNLQDIVVLQPDSSCGGQDTGARVAVAGLFPAEALILDTAPSTIKRFDPKYWLTNGPRTMSFSLVSPIVGGTQYNGYDLQLSVTSRRKNDLCGFIWETKDSKDHKFLSYEEKYDYTNEVLMLTLETTGAVCGINDPNNPITMTVTCPGPSGFDVAYFIPLRNYATLLSGQKYSVTLPFNNLRETPLGAPIPVINVKQLLISAVTTSYVKSIDSLAPPLLVNESGTMLMSVLDNVGRSTLTSKRVLNYPNVLGMSTGYDDSYDQNPQRLIDNIFALGYRGWIDHYVGMSHFFESKWNAAESRWKLDTTATTTFNEPARQWHRNFLEYAAKKLYRVQQSLSFEVSSDNCPFEWTQRDWDGNYGATGYIPPSWVLSPAVPEAQAFLKTSYKELYQLAAPNGQTYLQLGEPWWWYNTVSEKPCIYDFPTKVLFNTATGLFAQDVGKIRVGYATLNTTQQAYLNFVRDLLGTKCLELRDYIRSLSAVQPPKVTILFFLPTILGITDAKGEESVVARMNYPSAQFKFPNFDIFVSEAYDWILEGKQSLAYRSITLGTEELGYPKSQVQYLSGFVPDSVLAGALGIRQDAQFRRGVWQRIFGSVKNNLIYGVDKQYIWAYNQVMRDSITLLPHGDFDTFFFDGDQALPVIRGDKAYA